MEQPAQNGRRDSDPRQFWLALWAGGARRHRADLSRICGDRFDRERRKPARSLDPRARLRAGGERRDQIEPLIAKVGGLHERRWQPAIKATQDNAPLMAIVLPAINEVIDLHSTHLAMARRHLPLPIMVALLGTAAIGVGLLGFGNGRVRRRFSLLDSVYGVVLAVALWMTIDLDYPGVGSIGLSNRSFAETLATMK